VSLFSFLPAESNKYVTSYSSFIRVSGIAFKLKKACCFNFYLWKTILSADFCSSSSSPPFQPIKSHVTIPTAHVMPSTLGTSPAKPNSTPVGPSSSKLPLSGLAESVGMTRNGDLGAMKLSPGLSRDLVYLSGAPGENGIEQSWFPAVGHERQEEARKFDIPSMDYRQDDPHHRVRFHNPRTSTSKELYKVLPEAKKAPAAGQCLRRNGPHSNSQWGPPFGTPACSRALQASASQVWQPSPDTWQSPRHLSAALELIRLQMSKCSCWPLNLFGESFWQELQRENTFLRAQFAQKTEALSREKIDLEKKLSASEVEVQLIRESLKVALQKHSEEVKKQEERVKGRDKHINNLKKKCQKESEQNREKQQRIETLERYLADLPTLEDHQKQSQQLKDSELKSTELQEKVTELESLLEETQAICRDRETQLESLRQREAEFSSAGHSLQDKQSVEETSGEGPEVEMESWQKQYDSLQKIVEKQQQKMDQLRSQVQSLEQEVAQEEGTSQALREEAQRRDSALQQLRTAVKELSVQNQDLIEKNLTLQEHLRQAQPGSPPSPDTAQLALELYQELASCLQDLQAVCSIVTQRAQGHDPNLSLLLGIHSAQHPETQLDLQKPDVIKRKLEEVQQLRRDIEDLRTTMSDRYAQDMGENCVTQ
uniref:Centrosomal protein 85 n=1 Tax=Macaca nemestrina TaxID=9545 RepID=A0A2K6BE92_MACNE